MLSVSPPLLVGVGELAAMVVAGLWAGSSLCFGGAGRRIGSKQVNRIRLFLAIVLLSISMFVLGASWDLPLPQAALLAASGLIGLALGDATYFEALVILGPRRASLIQTLAPVFAVLLQIPLLNEGISIVGITGMAITLFGVAWVISERAVAGETHGSIRKGVIFAVIGAFGQGAGLILGKAGLGQADAGSLLTQIAGLEAAADGIKAGVKLHPVFGTLIRMVSAFTLLLAISLLRPRTGAMAAALKDRKALIMTTFGTIVGPFIGVSLALYAVANANTGVASTIMSTSPVLVIPLVVMIYGEKVSLRAIFGAVVAIGGVTVLMFREQILAALFG